MFHRSAGLGQGQGLGVVAYSGGRVLSLVSQTAYEGIRKSFQRLFHRKDVQAGVVASLQTFGSFAANFNPHCHGLVTEGVFTPQGEFLP
jgi:hypothetical protein